MKRFHNPGILICITACAFAARLAVAQLNLSFTVGENAIITMKSGDKYEGKVLQDAPDSVEIEYKPTPKSRDSKVLQKNEIASVKKKSAAEAEFTERALAKVLPTPDLRDASYYESTIQDKLRTFIAKHPGTPEAAEVEKIIVTLGEEKSRVVSGQVKMEGRWLDAATVKIDSYNINAYRQLLLMREKAAENKETRYLDALRAFEQLRAEHGVSPYFLKAVPEAQEYLKKFEAQLADMIREAPILLKNRTDGLKQLSPEEATAARRAIEEEDRAYKETVDRQTKSKIRWHDMSKFDVKGLQDLSTAIVKERAELAALDVPTLQADSEALMSVIHLIAEKRIAEASAALEKASKIQNPSYRALVQSLGKELTGLRDAAKKEQKAAAAPASAGTSSTTETENPGTNPVAEAMKKQLEEKKKKAAAAAKGPDGKTQPGGPQKPAVASATPEPKPSLMDMLNEYLPMIGGGLLVVIALAWFIGKRKKDKEQG